MTTSDPSRAVVFFGSVDWRHTWQRPQQLATRLARQGPVLYVNPLGLRSPRLADWRRLGARLGGRAAAVGPGVDLTVRSPLASVPPPYHPLATRLNAWLLRRTLRRWMVARGLRTWVFWIGAPSPAVGPAIAAWPDGLRVYDCFDDFAAFHGGCPAVAATERALAASADLVLAASATLHARMRALNPRTVLLPNAADYGHFAGWAALPPPPELAAIPRPILGYVGEIAWWFDLELVRELARARPDWSIVLVGPVHHPDRARLEGLPNLHLLGRREYRDLPAYVGRFDVCLLPFSLNALTAATCPVKLYEYLASGRPVVSTPLPEVLGHDAVVTVADRSGFGKAVEETLRSAEAPGARADRQAVARHNTWDHRIAEVGRLLEAPAVAGARHRRCA